MREISYSQNGEYQIPDISLEETRGTIGKYGMMRKEYLRNHKVARFNILTLQNLSLIHISEVKRECTSSEQVIKQPFQIIKAANNGKTDADLLSGCLLYTSKRK